MKTNDNFTFISFISGIFIIFFIIWNRFIRIRLPKELYADFENAPQIALILFLTVTFLIITLYYFLYLIKYLPREKSFLLTKLDLMLEYLEQYKSFVIFKKIVTEDIPNGPLAVYNWLFTYVIYVKPHVDYLGANLHNYLFCREFRITLCYIVVFVIPRIIVSLVFLVEVVYFKQLVYFYKVLVVLLIPLLSRLILFMIQHHAMYVLDYFDKYFTFRDEQSTNTLHIYQKELDPEDTEGLQNQKDYFANLENLKDQWSLYQYSYNITYQILENRVKKYRNLLYSVYYGMFFMGFMFYLLIIIGLW